MKPAELREEIAIELEALEATVNELLACKRSAGVIARSGATKQSPLSW
jgi:hypothetical protein